MKNNPIHEHLLSKFVSDFSSLIDIYFELYDSDRNMADVNQFDGLYTIIEPDDEIDFPRNEPFRMLFPITLNARKIAYLTLSCIYRVDHGYSRLLFRSL